ncbi:MAG: hypothetical protein K2I46_00025 [Clostridia bacterium]|nr:hypothetical protein [Clostridia bacterium]MDE6471904.1 hypothetical protein [Clostridia bacterium]
MVTTQLEDANYELKPKIGTQDLLIDLKVLIKEYYCGTFTNDGQSLVLSFFNGQRFALKIEEIA